MRKLIASKINEFIKSIPQLAQEYGFAIFFYTLWILNLWLSHQSFKLTNFKGRIISAATLSQLDVSGRITTTVISLVLVVLVGLAVSLIFSFFQRFLSSATRTVIKASSFVGLFSFFFYLFIPQDPPFFFLFAILSIHLLSILSEFLSRRWPVLQYLNAHTYMSWLFIISFSGAAFISDNSKIFNLLGFSHPPHDTIFIFIICTIIAFVGSLFWELIIPKKYRQKTSDGQLSTLLLSTAPLAFASFLPFFSKEAYLVANHHGINLVSPTAISTVGVIAIFFCSAVLFWISRFWKPSAAKLLHFVYFPMLIVSLGTLLWYTPLVPVPTDMFEPANSGLMIQQFFEFGKIPIIESFNAHVFSDAIWGFIYAGLNGYSATGWSHYDFLQSVFEMLVIYFFIKGITKNAYISLGTIHLVPQLGILFPALYTISLLVLGLFIYALRTQKLSSYVMLASALPLAILFRIDIGTSSIIAIIAAVILALSASLPLSIQWKKLVKIFAVIFIFASSLFMALLAIRETPIIPWLRDFSHILNSNQAFAYPALWNNRIDGYSIWHYFITPFVLVTSICALIIYSRLRRLTVSRVVLLSYFFLAAFTLINMALRGTVRHNLFENTTMELSTFATLLFGGLVFFMLEKKGVYVQFSGFMIATTFIIYQFNLIPSNPKTPILLKNTGIMSDAVAHLKQLPAVKPEQGRIERGIIPENIANSNFNEFANFINNQMKDKETFFDFSNSPMLYVYTHKETPFFTNHLMLMHDDYLQESALRRLKKYEIPVLVFAYTVPYNLDSVPFQIRYYKLAEYFYQNYHPYAIINSREIWIRNDWQPKNSSPKKELLGSKKLLSDVGSNSIAHNPNETLFQANGKDPFIYQLISDKKGLELQKQSYYYLYAEGESQLGGIMQLFYALDGSEFKEENSSTLMANSGQNYLYFPVTPKKEAAKLDDLRLDFVENDLFDLKTMQLIQSSDPIIGTIEDSVLPQNFQINYLPYIWGKYDSKIMENLPVLRKAEGFLQNRPNKEQTNVSFLSASGDDSNNAYRYDFPPLTDEEKKYGTYVVVDLQSFQVSETNNPNIILQYGDNTQTRGTVQFTAVNDGQQHKYVIRISAQYAWKDYQNTWLSLQNNSPIQFKINALNIIQAD